VRLRARSRRRRQPERNWHVISEHCRLLYSEPGDRLLGFDTRALSKLDLDGLEAEGLFEGPRFDVSVLGLRDATTGEIRLAARGSLKDEPTLDVAFFRAAVSAGTRGDLDEPEESWRLCLEAGGMEAHYGLGYTLLELDRPHDAYRHLRYYTEITPISSCSPSSTSPTKRSGRRLMPSANSSRSASARRRISGDDVIELRELTGLAVELGEPGPEGAARTVVFSPARLTLYRDALRGFVDSRDEAEWLREDDREPLARARELLPALDELSEEAIRAALEPLPRAT
jgi:hypothetical protein